MKCNIFVNYIQWQPASFYYFTLNHNLVVSQVGLHSWSLLWLPSSASYSHLRPLPLYSSVVTLSITYIWHDYGVTYFITVFHFTHTSMVAKNRIEPVLTSLNMTKDNAIDGFFLLGLEIFLKIKGMDAFPMKYTWQFRDRRCHMTTSMSLCRLDIIFLS